MASNAALVLIVGSATPRVGSGDRSKDKALGSTWTAEGLAAEAGGRRVGVAVSISMLMSVMGWRSRSVEAAGAGVDIRGFILQRQRGSPSTPQHQSTGVPSPGGLPEPQLGACLLERPLTTLGIHQERLVAGKLHLGLGLGGLAGLAGHRGRIGRRHRSESRRWNTVEEQRVLLERLSGIFLTRHTGSEPLAECVRRCCCGGVSSRGVVILVKLLVGEDLQLGGGLRTGRKHPLAMLSKKDVLPGQGLFAYPGHVAARPSTHGDSRPGSGFLLVLLASLIHAREVRRGGSGSTDACAGPDMARGCSLELLVNKNVQTARTGVAVGPGKDGRDHGGRARGLDPRDTPRREPAAS